MMSEPEFWKEKKLDELIQEKTIGLVKGSSLQGDCFEFDYVKMHNISSDNSWNPKGMVRVNATDEEVEKFSLQNNDFLFNTRNSYELVGKSCLYQSTSKKTVLFNNNIMRIKFSTEINPKFAAYAFCSKSVSGQLTSMKQGTTGVSGIYYKTLKNLRVKYPSTLEQKRIVAILDQAFADIEQARAKTEQNLKNARELFESYLQQVFSQRGEGWAETTLGELCERMEYGTSSKSQAEGDVPVLRMGNIQRGLLDWKKLVYTCNEDDIEKHLLKDNDVLFNRTNSPELVGKTAIYRNERPAIFAGYLIRIHRKENLLDAGYLNYYLNSNLAREYGYTIMSHSTNQANISGTKLKTYPINVPSLIKQKEFSKKFRYLEIEVKKLESIYKEKLMALDQLKKSILQKAFSGELTKPLDGDTNRGAAA